MVYVRERTRENDKDGPHVRESYRESKTREVPAVLR